jgi:hypothetical protein
MWVAIKLAVSCLNHMEITLSCLIVALHCSKQLPCIYNGPHNQTTSFKYGLHKENMVVYKYYNQTTKLPRCGMPPYLLVLHKLQYSFYKHYISELLVAT